MKVDDPKPVEPTAPSIRNRVVAAQEQPADARDERGSDAPGQEPQDIVNLHGLEAEEMSAQGRHLLMELVEESARLQSDLEESRRRIAELARLGDEDSLSGLMSRQIFVRELSGILSSSADLPETGALVFIKIENLEDLNARRGYASGDFAVIYVGAVLQSQRGSADISGRLAGAAFCHTLIGVNRADAEIRTEQLVEALLTLPTAATDAAIALEPAFPR